MYNLQSQQTENAQKYLTGTIEYILFSIIWLLNILVLFRCFRLCKGSKIFNYFLMSQNHSQQNEINAIAKSLLYRISYINSRYVSLPQVTLV